MDIEKTVANSKVTKIDRDDDIDDLYEIDVDGMKRSVSVHAKSEEDARKKVVEFLQDERERELNES